MNYIKRISFSYFTIFLLTACASSSNNEMQVGKSFLKNENVSTRLENAELINQTNELTTVQQQQFRFVVPMKINSSKAKSAEDVIAQFNDTEQLTISADALPLPDYLHYVFGEQFSVSYIIAEDVKSDNDPVTLNLQKPITEQKLFTLTEGILTQRGYTLRFDDNIFYIHKDNVSSKGNVVYGYGNSVTDVPNSSLDIVQMIPFEYGMQASLGNTLMQLLGVKALADNQRNSMTIKGKRKDIVRALEFIQILDQPRFRGRQIGVFKSTFVPTSELIEKLSKLLTQEGISVGESASLALSIVELDKQGELILFANNSSIIERAVYWLKHIDKPVLSAEKQYFIYQPQFSRAIDMGESLEALIGGGSNLGSSTSAENQNNSTSQSKVRSAGSADLKMVLDERANSLIFFTSGERYQQLLPLIKRLDVLPKQVVLEVMIAEVILGDTFKSGVEFNLTNQGATKVGGFNFSSDSKGLSYILSGTQGQLSIDLLSSNTNVNVLSRPSLLVRDGVTASINVGDSIPTVGETVFDSEGGSRTTVVYRNTGIALSVTPTINARGVIIMEINQETTNQVDGGGAVAGSPVISERSIKTEVIAENGDTIVLGGLIKESKTISDSSVPFFSSIPLIGKLFDTNSESKDKTELIVMVTPRIIESSSQWEEIKSKIKKSYVDLIIE